MTPPLAALAAAASPAAPARAPAPRPWAHRAVVLQAPAPLDAVFTPDVLAPALVRTCLARGVAVGGHVLHRFVPQGASVLLHGPAVRLALHTWPERGVATLDVLLPGEGPEDAQALVEAVAAALGMCVIEAHAPGRAG